MDLAAWLRRLEGLHPVEIDMGLGRVADVAAHLGIGKPAPLVFTVTGTNGKGSTCAALDSLLRMSGRHNERVCIDGRPVADEALCEAFEAIDQARGDISLTYFEFGTLAAFWLFQRAGLDAVVLEVGLGGRLDAVNIVDADVAVVTSIGLDHADYLGDTRDSVGYEKAGSCAPPVCWCVPRPICRRALPPVARLQVQMWQRGRDYSWQQRDGSWGLTGQRGGARGGWACRRSVCRGTTWRRRFDILGRGAGHTRCRDCPGVPKPRWPVGWMPVASTGAASPGSCCWMWVTPGCGVLAGYLASPAPDRARSSVFCQTRTWPVSCSRCVVAASWAVAPLPTPRSRPAAELAAELERAGAGLTFADIGGR